MSYRLVIFDFDGTLADSMAWMRSVLGEVARRYRFKALPQAELDGLRELDTRAIMARLEVPAWKLPFIARHMRQLAARDAHLIRPFAGVPELLDALDQRGITTAVVSSNAEANVRAVLGPVTASKIRHYACGAGLFGKRKKFRAVLRKTGVAPEQAIAVGDEVRDIEAAVGEGIAAGAVSWGYASRAALEAQRPAVLFDDMAALRDALTAAPRTGSTPGSSPAPRR